MNFDLSNIIKAILDFFNSIWSFLGNVYTKLAAIVAILAIVGYIYKYLKAKKGLKSWRENEISKLNEIADDDVLKLIKTHKYIQTMGQKEPPHEDETVFISPNRFSMTKKVLNDLLDKNHSLDKKRYMILGGSGMGKSTFLSALFYQYTNKNVLKKRPKHIYIKTLGNPKVIEELKDLDIKDPQQSILLLDALDENIDAATDIDAFMNKLENVTRDFRFVIITCRTQFFEDEDSEPNILRIRNRGGMKRSITYDKIYLSPFTKKETKMFLKRKYGLYYKKYLKSITIAKKCWDVLSRPMILSFIDDLMELDDINDITTIQIYSKIIDKWFDHETEIQDIKKSELYSFSKKITLFIYNKWIKSKSMVISNEEYKQFLTDYGYEQSPYSFKTRSLINRRADGSIKFSHRSFWEFFLAVYAYENPGQSFMGNGLEMAKKFLNDISYLDLHDIKLDFVQYKSFNLIDDTKTDIDIFKKRYKTVLELSKDLSSKEKNNHFTSALYDFWEIALIRLTTPRLFSLTKQETVTESIHGRSSLIIENLIHQESHFLHLIQDCFISQSNVYKLKNQYYILEDIERRAYTLNISPFVNVSQSTKIVFPAFDNLERLTSLDGIVLSNGFYSDENMYDFIQHIASSTSVITILKVFKDNINEIISFIHNLRFINIYNCKIKINISYNDYNIFYFVDKDSQDIDSSTIKTILQNMINAINIKELELLRLLKYKKIQL